MRGIRSIDRARVNRVGAMLVSGGGERRGVLLCVVSAVTIAIMLAALGTDLGALIARMFPYLVTPVLALAFLAADRTARTMPMLIWTFGVSLLAVAGIIRYPSVPILGVQIHSFAVFAALLIAGIVGIAHFCAHGARIEMRNAYRLIAGLAVLATLIAPIGQEVSHFGNRFREEVRDARTGGAVHTTELSRLYRPDYVNLMEIIKEKTPEDTVVAFPDQYAFPIVGNPELANYFLYPRTIKSANAATTPVFDISGAPYIIGVAGGNRNVWPVFSVPIRMYYHAQALHRVQFGEVAVTAGRETTKIAPADLQPWQTDADRTLVSDAMGSDGSRTVTLFVSASVSDPWVAAANFPLTEGFSASVPVTTNAGYNLAMAEQVALLAEVRGPGGETALFTSRPAVQKPDPQSVVFQGLFQRATEYARARGWRPGPLTVTHLGLDLGWQVPLSRTRTNTLVVVEDGGRTIPDGPATFARMASDAQRHLQAGNANAAVDEYAAALLLRPDNLDGQLALGEAFRRAQRWSEGAQFFAALLNDYPSNPWIRYSLAVMQQHLGDRAAARAAIAPVVADSVVATIYRPPNIPKPARARIAATATPAGYGAYYDTSMALHYETGDGSIGQVYTSVNDGPETLAFTGTSNTLTFRPPSSQTTVVYRLYANTDHATLLDAVTIAYQSLDAPPQNTLWANMLDAQLAAEMGDMESARATYRAIVTNYPGEYQLMAEAALAALDRGK